MFIGMNKIHEKFNQTFYYNQITMNTILLMPENLINFGISLDSVQRKLDKVAQTGILISKWQGRRLVFTWNPKSRSAMRLKDLVAVAYDGISP